MLSWAVTFLVVAIIAGILGLSGVAGTATQIAYVLFVVFLIFAAVSFVMGRRPPVTRPTIPAWSRSFSLSSNARQWHCVGRRYEVVTQPSPGRVDTVVALRGGKCHAGSQALCRRHHFHQR